MADLWAAVIRAAVLLAGVVKRAAAVIRGAAVLLAEVVEGAVAVAMAAAAVAVAAAVGATDNQDKASNGFVTLARSRRF
ncbi:MAG: hypothetical protein WBS22_01285 [Methylocystis sp.]